MVKRTASYLLPDPGGEVVRELLDQIEKRDADLRKLVADMKADCAMGQIKIATTHWRRRIEKLLER